MITTIHTLDGTLIRSPLNHALATSGHNYAVAVSNIVSSAFTPVLAKHTKSFDLLDTLSVGVDRIQRNFEPMQRQVESWRQTQITDAEAKLILILLSSRVSSTLRRATRSPFLDNSAWPTKLGLVAAKI